MRRQFPVRKSHRRHWHRPQWTNRGFRLGLTQRQPKSELRIVQETQSWRGCNAIAPARSPECCWRKARLPATSRNRRRRTSCLSVPRPEPSALKYNAPAVPRANETVVVTAESPACAGRGLLHVAQNARAVVKAKQPRRPKQVSRQRLSTSAGEAPLQGRNVVAMAKLAAPPSDSDPQCHLDDCGRALQRSLDSGRMATRAACGSSVVVYAPHDQDVWAGGQAGALFHSADSGVTWLRVQPSVQGQPLTSDITHIEVRAWRRL